LGLLLAPLATIWALNVLFPALAIPYSIETWFAIILLIGVGKTTITARKE
jgi:predicted RND superfamily exporter protein